MKNKPTTYINDELSDEVLDKTHLEEREKLRSASRVSLDRLKSTFSEPEPTHIDSNNIEGTPNDEAWRTHTLSGSTSGFNGELTFQHRYIDGYLHFKTLTYRITRPSNQNSGNKANINIVIDNSAGQSVINSPDSMWQDGGTYPYQRETTMRIWDKWATIYVQFIFDKTQAADPRVTVSKQYYY